jgi:hypothetical protein
VPIKELLDSPDEASVRLSNTCHGVFQGRRTLRGACRDLDILAYGAEIERRGLDIGSALMKEDNK